MHCFVGMSGLASVHLPSLCGSIDPSEPLHLTDPVNVLAAWPQAMGQLPTGCNVCQSYVTQAVVAAQALVGAAGFVPVQSLSLPREPSLPLQVTLPVNVLASMPHLVAQLPTGSICVHSYLTQAAVAVHSVVRAAGFAFVHLPALCGSNDPSEPLHLTVPVSVDAAWPQAVGQEPSGCVVCQS